MSGVEIKGGKDEKYEEPKRKWRVDFEKKVVDSIVANKDKFDRFLRVHNNTSNKEVWKIYDHLTDDLFHEIYADAIKDVNQDLEAYLEKVIFEEF